jgi:hypothetical protein
VRETFASLGPHRELTDNLDVITSHWKYLPSEDEFTARDDANEIVARTLMALSQISKDRYRIVCRIKRHLRPPFAPFCTFAPD